MKIELVNKSNNPTPTYNRVGDSGMDIRAFLNEPITLQPLERTLIHTGIYVNYIPEGYEIQVRPRSGLTLKRGLTVLNTPGTIDSNYRGELGIILVNFSAEPQTIETGDRIAQLVVAPITIVDVEEINEVSNNSERGADGFGSSGIK